MRLLAAALAALTLVLGAAACGGGGDSDTLSAEELRSQADEICRETERKLGRIDEPESIAGLGAYFEEAIPIFRDQVEQLDELEPPEDLEEDWNRAMRLNRRSLETAEQAQNAAEDKDERALQRSIERGQETEAELDALARELGLEVCGEDST